MAKEWPLWRLMPPKQAGKEEAARWDRQTATGHWQPSPKAQKAGEER